MPNHDDSRATSRLVALGELLVDVSPQTSGTSLEDDGMLQPLPGGAPANVAYAAALLGASSAFVGAVGSDPFGRRLRRIMKEAGVDVSGVVSADAQTAVAFVALGEDGEREFMF
ncbi:MAG TPA: PfkB family carbohydrate kinase, partial [Trueperaceae bacterium]|nr:PfkB family carbohydrate kinase [Trueperaceae bacterium]